MIGGAPGSWNHRRRTEHSNCCTSIKIMPHLLQTPHLLLPTCLCYIMCGATWLTIMPGDILE